jgi:hypothetical protein
VTPSQTLNTDALHVAREQQTARKIDYSLYAQNAIGAVALAAGGIAATLWYFAMWTGGD